MKIAISDHTFIGLFGSLNLPTYLLDSNLNYIIKTNIAGKILLEEKENIISNFNKDEILEQLETVGVFFLKDDIYIKSFSKISLEGVDTVLITVSETNVIRERRIIKETTKALKKEVVNHSITKKELERSNVLKYNIINSNTDMLLMVGSNQLITNSNQVLNSTLNYNENELLGKKAEVIFKDKNKYMEICNVIIDKNKFEGKVDLLCKNGDIYPTYLSIIVYKDSKQDLLFIIKDLSDKITIKKQALKMKAIFNSGDHIIWSIDENFSLTSFNENYKILFNNLYKEDPKLHQHLNTIEHRIKDEIKVNFWNNKYNDAFNGKTVFFETKLDFLDGSYEYMEIHLNPIIDENDKITEVSGIGINVTKRKETQLLLNKNTTRYNSIFHNSAVNIWSVDANNKITACNHSFERLMYNWFNRIVTINSDFEDYLTTFDNREALKVFNNKIKKTLKNNKQVFEIDIVDKFGKVRYLEVYMNPISYDSIEIKEISCLAIDISHSKLASMELNESLKEKETLLQEVHHRVKNNLQIVSSILNLQASYIKDENSLQILTESQNRITSMSYIHESLYMNKNFRYIDFAYYIRNLSANLIQSYSISPDKVKLEMEVEDIQLSLDQAIPCGLILNELISNSLKYAFPKDNKGTINLKIKENNQKIYFEIQDNGVGMPDDYDIENSDSLGLQLVFILVEQLDGNIKIENNRGSKFFINFDKIQNS